MNAIIVFKSYSSLIMFFATLPVLPLKKKKHQHTMPQESWVLLPAIDKHPMLTLKLNARFSFLSFLKSPGLIHIQQM